MAGVVRQVLAFNFPQAVIFGFDGAMFASRNGKIARFVHVIPEAGNSCRDKIFVKIAPPVLHLLAQ
jgi:hypothetical protein